MAFKKTETIHSKSYNIGDMTHSIQIQRRYEVPNHTENLSIIQGFKTVFEVNCCWKTLKSDYIEVDSAGLQMAEKLKSVANAKIIIPYRQDIDTECYVVYNNSRYKILDVQSVEQKNIYLECSLMFLGSINLKGNEQI